MQTNNTSAKSVSVAAIKAAKPVVTIAQKIWVDTKDKPTQIPGTTTYEGICFPSKIHYLIGTKEKGAKVSLQLMKNGEIKQLGTNTNGDAIFSNPLFRVERFIGQGKDWIAYIKKATNCVDVEVSDSKGTSEYRKAYEGTLCSVEVAEANRLASLADGADKAISYIKDELEKRSTVVINAEKTLLRKAMKAITNPPKAKAVPATETVETIDEAAKEEGQAAFIAAVVMNPAK